MVNATKQKPLCRNIGYYFQQYSMIPDKLIIRELKKKKNRVFSLLPTGNSELYINQEVLLMTQIGLFKDTEKNKDIRKLNQIHFKKNFPYKKEVYFDSLISQALKNYSWQWDTPINYYLRLGELYFNHPSFTNYSSRYGSTLDEAKKNIKLKINEIDRCFLQAAPRNQNDTKVYYRGMKQGYDFPMNGNEVIIGSEIIVSNYISISTSRNIARQFARRNAIWGQPVTEMCCIYNITIDKGVPIVDMITNTTFKREKEMLLPRNLVLKCCKKELPYKHDNSEYEKYEVYHLHASLMDPNQFLIDTGCRLYPSLDIKPVTLALPKKKKTKQPKTPPQKVVPMTPANVEANLEPAVPAKLPRCPKGSRRDKKTKLCVDKNGRVIENQPVGKSLGPKTKKKRCPKGTRRNKQTGVCEPR